METMFERLRRLRSSDTIRRMVRETQLSVNDLIYPVFVVEGENIKEEVPSMPGVYHFSLDRLDEEIEAVRSLHIPAIIVFGVPRHKDALGSEAYAEQGIVQRAIRQVKEQAPDLVVIADTCLCQYTDHGHCGIVEDGQVKNDPSLELLVKTAVSQARAGADVIAPSNMMDGFVYAIRHGLDEAGYEHVPIMSYAVKYASAFYGPFRDAAHSAPQFGDRKTYQMDPANRLEALREAQADIEQGADMLMVKPAMAYMDVIRELKDRFPYPLAAYNVSGEYAMIKAAAQNGWINEQEVVLELLTGLKRAGADLILTYFAKDVAKWLGGKHNASF
ncbi:porphobilinogen synthase [Caldalkalibacillus thermarum TA2.A1]|uniref:Delta-aminolevulinic acid dehydratase n=2 Tax=Caldalkalibacillus thermarum (strain TA2.A1) TaxID=986075 RepID=A0A8X8L6X9_CALTT|nr:porphobilinogen synthase [Caldalkalibacillus thermarum]QZT33532.1 porphobilinogen synthase [Caldalkalibacillus thermarum TA2.A1]